MVRCQEVAVRGWRTARRVGGPRLRGEGGRSEQPWRDPVPLAADQLPAARNRSTTLCGMRPRGETAILLALAHARTAWGL